jgi:hypothetical protein
MLTPDEIVCLVREFQDESDPDRAAQLKEKIIQGFYGS